MFGPDSYYAKDPRLEDWEDFKETVCKYYRGELKANPITSFNIDALKGSGQKRNNSTNSGCLGVVIMLIGLFSVLGIGIYNII